MEFVNGTPRGTSLALQQNYIFYVIYACPLEQQLKDNIIISYVFDTTILCQPYREISTTHTESIIKSILALHAISTDIIQTIREFLKI
jgi:hypothetical protein